MTTVQDDDVMSPADILEFAERFCAATFAGDIATLRSLYAADAVIWHNTDRREIDVDTNLAIVAWIARTLPDQTYEIIRREVLHDGYMQQDLCHATLPDGSPYSQTSCVIVRLRKGLVARFDEYLDSAEVRPLVELHAAQRVV